MVDYASALRPQANPIEKALSMYGKMSAVQQNKEVMQNRREDREAAKRQQAQLQSDLYNLSEKTDAGAADYVKVMTKHPTLSAHLKQSYGLLSEDQKVSSRKNMTPVFMALEMNDIEGAKSLLEVQKAAATEAGLTDQVAAIDSKLQMLEMNPNAVKSGIALSLANSMGEEDFVKMYGQIGDERRKRGLQPGKVELGQEDIKKRKAEITKIGKESGLKDKQILKTMKETEKLGLEVQKLAMELEATKSGGAIIPPEKVFEAEHKLQKDYTALNKDFIEMQRMERNIQGSPPDGSGDLMLVTSFMKLLDPGSVVRETEFANALKTSGQMNVFLNWGKKVQDGDILPPPARIKFKATAQKLIREAAKAEAKTKAKYQKMVENYGLNPENVFILPDYEEGEQPTEGTPEEMEQAATNVPQPAVEVAMVSPEQLAMLD